MFGFSIWELLVVLAIVLLLFGPKRIKTLGGDLGNAIKGFRTAVKEEEPEPTVDPKIIEGEVANNSNTAANSAETKQSDSVR